MENSAARASAGRTIDELTGKVIVPSNSAAGRQLQALKRIARNRPDAVFWETRARKINKGPLGNDKSRELRGLTNALTEAEQAAENAGRSINDDKAVLDARDVLAQFIQGIQTTGKVDTIFAIRKAGLLTNLVKTGLRNLLGNLGFASLNEVARTPSALADMALNRVFQAERFGGLEARRTLAASRVQDLRAGIEEAATTGIRRAGETLRTGSTTSEAGKIDLQEIRSTLLGKAGNTGNKIIDGYVNGIIRVQVASDQPFRVAAFQGSLRSQARARALTMIERGETKPAQLESLTQDIVQRPPDDLIAEAIYDAEVAVFANQNRLAKSLNELKRIPVFGRVVDLVIPFTTVPTNVVARALEFTPGGLVKGLGQAALQMQRRALTAQQQKAIAQSIGRGATGSATMYMGYLYFQQGILTEQRSGDPAILNKQEIEGRPPGSILLGGKWRKITGNPIGDMLVLGATLAAADFGNTAKDMLAELLDVAVRTTAGLATELPAFEAATEFAELGRSLASGRDRDARFQAATKFGGKLAGSFVPSFVAGTALQLDRKKRRTRPDRLDSFTEIFQAPFKSRVPGLRETLPLDRTEGGRVQRLGDLVGGDPLNTTTPLPRLPLSRLMEKVDVGIPSLRQKIGEPDFQFTLRQQRGDTQMRRRLRELALNPTFLNMPPERQKLVLRNIISLSRREVN